MNLNEVAVLLVLAVCCFVANVLHGLTGCGSILVLQALWQTAVTFAPGALHNSKAFADENVKDIAQFSYVLTFFIQVVLTGLLFFDERRKRARQVEQGVPTTPSGLNGVLLLAFIPCSFVGAAIGVYTMPSIRENGARIILGGSSLFFALTFLSLYQMKYLEKKKTEDVIRDDLMLMRIQSEMQRDVILQYVKDKKRRKVRKERRRRHRAQRRLAKKARRRELRAKALAEKRASGGSSNSGSSAVAAADGGADGVSPQVVVPTVEGREREAVPTPKLEGAPLEASRAEMNPNRLQQRKTSLADMLTGSRTNRPLGVHGSSCLTSPNAQMISDIHLPASVTGDVDGAYPVDYLKSPGHRHHRIWIKDVDVQTYIRRRLGEISRHVDSPEEELAHQARLAAWTLRAMRGHSGGSDLLSPTSTSPADDNRISLGGSSTSSDNSGTEASDSTSTSTTASTARRTSDKEGKEASPTSANSEVGVPQDPLARTVRFDSSAEAAAEREELHKKWKQLLGKDSSESMDLSKSIAMAAATAPRRVVMGHAEILNIGLREAQQQQLKSLQELNAVAYTRDEHRHHRILHFMRMDGGVVMSAMVSSFFSGLLGSYTGVADPPLMIFALAMDISVPELRINYAVSSIVPAALRAVVGIADGFANTSLFLYYLVSVLFAWGGVAFGLHISHLNAITHSTFMIATLATLTLVAFLMLVPIERAFIRLVATAAGFVIVALAVFRQQKKPEHRRPPAPPNTPATAAEVEAFEQYWRQHSRRQRAFVDYENEGSAFSIDSSGCSSSAVLAANVSPTSVSCLPPQQPQQKKTKSAPASGSGTLESEDLPVRSRLGNDEEELITIVPVKATSHV